MGMKTNTKRKKKNPFPSATARVIEAGCDPHVINKGKKQADTLMRCRANSRVLRGLPPQQVVHDVGVGVQQIHQHLVLQVRRHLRDARQAVVEEMITVATCLSD